VPLPAAYIISTVSVPFHVTDMLFIH